MTSAIYNDISDDEASCIASAITANKYLHHASFTSNKFGNHGIKAILNAMSTINSLQFVNLGSYSITDDLAVELEEVASCNGALESIFLYKYAIQKVKLKEVLLTKLTNCALMTLLLTILKLMR